VRFQERIRREILGVREKDTMRRTGEDSQYRKKEIKRTSCIEKPLIQNIAGR
jgi:hypothetical protein